MRGLMWCVFLVPYLCLAAPKEVEQQAGYLQQILRQADEAYYNKHESIISDAAYDALREQYDRLVETFPELGNLEAVGASPVDAEEPLEHSVPVLSLQKAYTDEAVETFISKCGMKLNYGIEPKIDGLTVVLRYRNGRLTQAITRGDGKAGMDVTAALLASGCVPMNLDQAPEILDVRGEVFMPHTAFNALNERRRSKGKDLLKSPRNTAAGTLRLDDYTEVSRRGLAMQIFELLETDSLPATHSQALAWMKEAGLPVVECKVVGSSQVLSAIKQMNIQRLEMPFMTDGLVVKVNDRAVFQKLGATAHHPRGALARKYKTSPVETKLMSVEWSKGTTGKITPVAHFTPVEIQGATIQSATLHSPTHLRALDLKLGDWIQVVRAGGAVPEIIGICPGRRTGEETPIPTPEEM
ncbi:MAG: hypothetical protein OES84_06175 [Kiritimatiellaceae bacterium]|nr:hypothetical protein [Kiritimatiellaceae bacterium]